jgi:HlyD family secretion protein
MKLESETPTTSEYKMPDVNKKKRNPWLMGVVLFILLLGSGGLLFRQINITQRQEQQKKIRTTAIERVSLPITIAANGTIKPEQQINVSPKQEGRLKSLLVKEGDRVQQGQIIAYMDDSNLQGQLLQARGELEEAIANLQKAIAGNRPQEIAQTQARLRNAVATLDRTEDELRRNQQIYQSGAIPLQTLIQKRTERDIAQAQVLEAQEALNLSQAGSRQEDINAARARVTKAQGNLQNIQTTLDDTIIRSPFNGVINRKYADPGDFVTPRTASSEVSSATSSSILSLANNNQVVADVAENSIAQIKLGQKVTFKADAYPGKTFTAKVIQIGVESTVKQNVTSFEVKAAIDSDSKNLLRSGMNVNVEFQAGQLRNTLVVPTVAIVRQPDGTGVFVAKENNQPDFVPIVTGITVNNKTEIKSGLKGNERVFISFPPGFRKKTEPRGLPGFGGR